jgi:hypothetical protein
MVECRMCGKRTHSNIDGYSGLDLCRPCRETCEWENVHSDEAHATRGPVAGCPICKTTSTPTTNATKTAAERGKEKTMSTTKKNSTKKAQTRGGSIANVSVRGIARVQMNDAEVIAVAVKIVKKDPGTSKANALAIFRLKHACEQHRFMVLFDKARRAAKKAA